MCPELLDENDDLLSDAALALPAQWWATHHKLTAMQRLFVALLLEAFAALHHRRARVRTDAFHWLTGTTWYAPRLTVEMVATGLHLEVEMIARCASRIWQARRQRTSRTASSARVSPSRPGRDHARVVFP